MEVEDGPCAAARATDRMFREWRGPGGQQGRAGREQGVMYADRNDNENPVLPPVKNLHATVPPALLARIEQAAESERVTLEEFVTEAMERSLSRSWLDEAVDYGKQRAKARGLKPSDVEKVIAEVRAEDAKRGR